MLFERLDWELAEPRERYYDLMKRPDDIEMILRDGARKARERSAPLLSHLREAVGLGTGGRIASPQTAIEVSKTKAKTLPQWKRYVDSGQYFAKLVDADGVTLIQSKGFSDARQVVSFVDAQMSFAARPNYPGPAPDVIEFASEPEKIAEAVRLIEEARKLKMEKNKAQS